MKLHIKKLEVSAISLDIVDMGKKEYILHHVSNKNMVLQDEIDEPWWSEGDRYWHINKITLDGSKVVHYRALVYDDDYSAGRKTPKPEDVTEDIVDIGFEPEYYMHSSLLAEQFLREDEYAILYGRGLTFLKEGAAEEIIAAVEDHNKKVNKIYDFIDWYHDKIKSIFSGVDLPYDVYVIPREIYDMEKDIHQSLWPALEEVKSLLVDDPYYPIGDLKLSQRYMDNIFEGIVILIFKDKITIQPKEDLSSISEYVLGPVPRDIYDDVVKAKGYEPVWVPRPSGHHDWNYGSRYNGIIIPSDIEPISVKDFYHNGKLWYLFALCKDYKEQQVNSWVPRHCIKSNNIDVARQKFIYR